MDIAALDDTALVDLVTRLYQVYGDRIDDILNTVDNTGYWK